jgi:hypothetical protein
MVEPGTVLSVFGTIADNCIASCLCEYNYDC